MTKIEIDISLYIYGYNLDPDQVTKLLQLEPRVTGRRGVPRFGQQGRQYAPLKSGVWGYRIRGTDQEKLVDQFLANVGQRDKILESIPDAEEGFIEVYVMMTTEGLGGSYSIEISAAQHKALSSYGVPIHFTVNFGPDDAQENADLDMQSIKHEPGA
jgi:hypothetical protein